MAIADTPSTEQILRRSVQEKPTGINGAMPGAGNALVLSLATVADSFVPWGSAPAIRDRQLRTFLPTEPILASALYNICIRNAAFAWELDGQPQSVEAMQDILVQSEMGAGWQVMMVKVCTDLFSQDNGAFIEVIREGPAPDSPVINLAHLDAARCQRTGDPEVPVIYHDRKNVRHKLEPHQIRMLAEFPSPIETMNGVQLCAVSRVLRAAQLLRDVSIYQREKVSGNNPNAIHLVSGVSSAEISDAMNQHKLNQEERGMQRWIVPAVIATLDPTANVSHEQIDLKTLPDGFDMDEVMKWYINQLALGFGADYQDFAPLPGKNLGTSTQSVVLHEKSRGKGPAFFMSLMEFHLNFGGIMPSNVTFRYQEMDDMEDLERAEVAQKRGEVLVEFVTSGILTVEGAQQMMLDEGIISQEIFDLVNAAGDSTPDVVAQDTEPVENKEGDIDDKKKKPKRRGSSPYKAAVEARADFAEEERKDLEDQFEEAVVTAFNELFKKAKKSMGISTKMIGGFGLKQEPPSILGDELFWTEYETTLLEVGLPLSRATALEAVDANLALGLNISFDTVNEQVLDFSSRWTNEWLEDLATTTRRNLQTSIDVWQTNGLGRRGFPDLVKSIEPMFGRTRAKLIATNSVTEIFDEGNRLSHNSAGILTEEWQTARDAHVEDICRPLDGQQFPTNSGPRPVKDTHLG